MLTINLYAFIEGLEVSFKADVVERKAKLFLHSPDGSSISYLDSSALEDDETAKRFLHGVIDGFFAKKNKQAEGKCSSE